MIEPAGKVNVSDYSLNSELELRIFFYLCYNCYKLLN